MIISRLAILLVVWTVFAWAQAPTQSFTRSVNWTARQVPIGPLQDGPVTISLDLASGTEWVVGVEVDGSKPAEVAVAEVQFVDPSTYPKAGIRAISAVIDLPLGQLKIAGNLIGVSTSRVSGAVLTHVRLPAAMRVLIVRNGQMVSSAIPSTGLLVHDGVVVPQSTVGIRPLLMQLVAPKRQTKAADITRLPNGMYIASVGALTKHLVAFKRPAFGKSASCCGVSDPVTLRIRIDEGGRVQEMRRVLGNQTFADVCQDAVRQWEFRPFTYDGKPVPITTSVMFFVGSDGTVTSPVLQ